MLMNENTSPRKQDVASIGVPFCFGLKKIFIIAN